MKAKEILTKAIRRAEEEEFQAREDLNFLKAGEFQKLLKKMKILQSEMN